MTLLETCKKIAQRKLMEKTHRYTDKHHLADLGKRHNRHPHKGKVLSPHPLAEEDVVEYEENENKKRKSNDVLLNPQLNTIINSR